jgi:hypothetical protein
MRKRRFANCSLFVGSPDARLKNHSQEEYPYSHHPIHGRLVGGLHPKIRSLRSYTMKKMITKLTLAACFLMAGGTTPLLDDGGGIPPLCYPKACPIK